MDAVCARFNAGKHDQIARLRQSLPITFVISGIRKKDGPFGSCRLMERKVILSGPQLAESSTESCPISKGLRRIYLTRSYVSDNSIAIYGEVSKAYKRGIADSGGVREDFTTVSDSSSAGVS